MSGDRLASTRAVDRRPAADGSNHTYRLGRFLDRQVHDVPSIDDSEVNRLPRFLHQPHDVPPTLGDQLPPVEHQATKLKQIEAESVGTVLSGTLDIAATLKGHKKPVNGSFRKVAAAAEFGHPQLRIPGEGVQQIADSGYRLNAGRSIRGSDGVGRDCYPPTRD